MFKKMDNSSTTKIMTLSGLQEVGTHRYMYFALTLIIYLLIVFANLSVILMICLERGLHEPMYIFLCNLCINGLIGTVAFYPKVLLDILSDLHVIWYSECLAQAFVIYTSVLCEVTLLTVMAYDRYVAICRPLQCQKIMTTLMVRKLLLYAWLYPISALTVVLVLTLRRPLCGSHIDKLYCDGGLLMKLSCIPPTTNIIFGNILVIMQLLQVLFIMYSYSQIVRACLRSREGRTKFMETCLPHLLTLASFMAATLFDYMYSRLNSKVLPLSLRNFMAVEFLVVPPLLNPILYGFKLKQLRSSFFRIFSRSRVSNGFGLKP